jgi:hypothetical protein
LFAVLLNRHGILEAALPLDIGLAIVILHNASCSEYWILMWSFGKSRGK